MSGWKPKKEWFEGLSPEAKQKYAEKLVAKELAAKKPTKKRRRTSYRGRRRSYSNSAAPIIVSAGVGRQLRGYGAYGVQGGISGTILGQDYNLKGFYDSDASDGPVRGYGAYNLKNQGTASSMIDLGSGVPTIVNTKKGEAVIISHREYLGELVSGTGSPSAFKLQSFELNPGNSILFPWGARIAQQFEEYEIRGMIVELKTESSDYAASLSMGTMFMAANYNSSAPPPSSKIQLENYEYSSSSKPSKSLIMPIECSPVNNTSTHLRIADDGNYEGQDKLWYDWANIYIGSQGIPTAGVPIAEIWVSYEIALFKPWVSPQSLPQGNAITAHIHGSNADADAPFGDPVSWTSESSPLFTQTAADEITFPSYVAMYQVTYAAISATASGSNLLANFTANGDLEFVTNFWSTGSGTGIANASTLNSTTKYLTTFMVKMNGNETGSPSGSLTLSTLNYPVGVFTDLVITAVQYGIN